MTRNHNILVTGGGGYIGSHAVIELINRGYPVVVVDNLQSCYSIQGEKPETITRIEELTGTPIPFHRVNVLNTSDLRKILRESHIDCVLHFADIAPDNEDSENVKMLLSLLGAMKRENVKKLVLSSTAMVYGTPQFLPVTEEHPTGIDLRDAYATSKHMMEGILKELCNMDSSWKAISLRFYDAVGAHESGVIGDDAFARSPKPFLLISEVAVGNRGKARIVRAEYDAISGEGIKDFLHVTDIALAHILAMEKLLDPSFVGWKAYNLGNSYGYPLVKVIETFSLLSEKPIGCDVIVENSKDFERYADGSLAKKELGWQITKSFDEMCLDTMKWQRQNPNGYKNS